MASDTKRDGVGDDTLVADRTEVGASGWTGPSAQDNVDAAEHADGGGIEAPDLDITQVVVNPLLQDDLPDDDAPLFDADVEYEGDVRSDGVVDTDGADGAVGVVGADDVARTDTGGDSDGDSDGYGYGYGYGHRYEVGDGDGGDGYGDDVDVDVDASVAAPTEALSEEICIDDVAVVLEAGHSPDGDETGQAPPSPPPDTDTLHGVEPQQELVPEVNPEPTPEPNPEPSPATQALFQPDDDLFGLPELEVQQSKRPLTLVSEDAAELDAEPRGPLWRHLKWPLVAVVAVGLLLGGAFAVREPMLAWLVPLPPPLDVQATLSPREQAQEHYLEGIAALERSQLAQARQAFEQALNADPTMAQAYRGLAIVFANMGDKELAAQRYRDYLKAQPDAKDAADVRKILDDYARAQAREAKN